MQRKKEGMEGVREEERKPICWGHAGQKSNAGREALAFTECPLCVWEGQVEVLE